MDYGTRTRGRSSSTLQLITACAALLFATPAQAQEHAVSVQLAYERDPALRTCPTEESFRNLVSARLGYEPFAHDAAVRIAVRLAGSHAGVDADVDVADGHGQRIGSRHLHGARRECRDLASALAVAISIAIDPLRYARDTSASSSPPPRASARPPANPSSSSPPPSSPAPPTPRAPSRLRVELGAGGLLTAGVEPSIGGGAFIAAGLRYIGVSAALEGSVETGLAPASVTPSDRVQTVVFTAALTVCGHHGFLLACLVGAAGALNASDIDLPSAPPISLPYAGIGVRGGVEIGLTDAIALRGVADVLASVARTNLRMGSNSLWTTSPVTGDLRAEVIVRFR